MCILNTTQHTCRVVIVLLVSIKNDSMNFFANDETAGFSFLLILNGQHIAQYVLQVSLCDGLRTWAFKAGSKAAGKLASHWGGLDDSLHKKYAKKPLPGA